MSITRQQALDGSAAVCHWLLEIDHAGVTRRFSQAAVATDWGFYAGGMEITSAPTQSVDVYRRTASATRCTLTLAPVPIGDDPALSEMRPCDLEDTTRAALIGSPSRLYRWYEDTADNERDCIIDGHVTGANADGYGALSITIEDFSVWYGRKILPSFVCEQAEFPSADEDDRDRRAPTLYGIFKDIEVPNVHKTSDYFAIGHAIDSVSGGRVAGVSSTPTKSDQTTSDGTPYTRLAYPVATDNQDASVNGIGMPDDADGTYGGTAGAALTNIADQLKHLSVEDVGIPWDKVDHGSFSVVREAMSAVSNTIALIDESDLFAAAADVGGPFGIFLFHERGKLVLRRLDFASPARMEIRVNEALSLLEDVSWSGYEDVPAGLEIKYKWAWSAKKKVWDFKAKRRVKPVDFAPFLLSEQGGGSPLKIEARHVHDDDAAEKIVSFSLALWSKTRRTYRASARRETSDLRIFDVVLLTSPTAPGPEGSGMERKAAVIVGIEYGIDEQKFTLLEC